MQLSIQKYYIQFTIHYFQYIICINNYFKKSMLKCISFPQWTYFWVNNPYKSSCWNTRSQTQHMLVICNTGRNIYLKINTMLFFIYIPPLMKKCATTNNIWAEENWSPFDCPTFPARWSLCFLKATLISTSYHDVLLLLAACGNWTFQGFHQSNGTFLLPLPTCLIRW